MIKRLSACALVLAVLLLPSIASAHVVVKPATVNVGEFTTYTVSVPNERNFAVTEIKIEIPSGLQHVTPTVKNGWTVTPQKPDEDAPVTAITWTGGLIPAGLRDDFTFSAQAPEKESTIVWKAYQTYEDGKVVSWNQAADSKSEDKDSGPYSTTQVVADLQMGETVANAGQKSINNTLPIALSLLAIVISLGGLLFVKKR